MVENIEILSVSLLDDCRPTVIALRRLARSLKLEFGWHYLLDLTWILSQLGQIRGKRVMDAGAGTGLIQWYLADQGAQVTSVDRSSRADLPLRFRRRFRVKGLRQQDLMPASRLLRSKLKGPGKMRVKAASQARDLISIGDLRRSSGQVVVYNQDLKSLGEIKDDSQDAVVAVSALEHNPPEDLEAVVAELSRVLKPGGLLLATLCAARDQDWFHQPSKGWCYTDTTLRRRFHLSESTPSNYDYYDEYFTALENCAELRDNLSAFYYKSGDNGMPWGKWEPQYQPVGVCKIKG
jgi:2-polyprenyl-3-methyl-5-hydroxy-6-metoxy-1,4-benzoquinol methylase